MISFSALLPPAALARAAPATDAAAELRLLLAMRGWVDPVRLLPEGLATTAEVLDAVAPDVQLSLRDHPGLWLLRDQERQRLLTTLPAAALARAIAPRDAADEKDPVRGALALRQAEIPGDLKPVATEVLTWLASSFAWLDHGQGQGHAPRAGRPSFWHVEADAEGARQRVLATLARRRRRDDVERMTKGPLYGRDADLDMLAGWATAPVDTDRRGRLLYLSGIGGAGKSTLFALLEKRLWAAAAPPLLVHVDCDEPGFDSTDPVALDLALFPQLAVARPADAPDFMRRANALARATAETDAAYLDGTSRGATSRGRRRRGARKAEANRPVDSYVGLESAVSQKAGERSSISDNALSRLGPRTLVLLFDTAELMLARTAFETSSEIAGTAAWLGSLTGLMNGADVRVLMAGRNPPGDREVEALGRRVARWPGWRVDPPMVLADLGQQDAAALLAALGVDDAAVADRAATVLPRTPLILKIAADVYRAGGPARAGLVSRLEAEAIDPSVARRYLTERIVDHLASPAARPHALAAMALPRVTAPLLAAAVLPAETAPDHPAPPAAAVMLALRQAGWLVREEQGGTSLTFHAEIRRLALDLMASDPGLARQLLAVRRRARDYHARRRKIGDATFRTYYDLLLGTPVRRLPALDLDLLGAAVEDLPQPARTRLAAPGRAAVAGIAVAGVAVAGVAVAGAAASLAAWTAHVEGSGRRDGEGDRLVKRGHADAALELYRGRPTRAPGVPPTFVLQALADGGYFASAEADIEALVAEATAELAKVTGASLPNWLRSRIYWLTRYTLMARPRSLSPAHHVLLAKVAHRVSGSGPVLLFPAVTAVAEAFAPRRGPIAPNRWFETRGAIESETRLFLVDHTRFGRNPAWLPHVDALFVLQPDWPQRAARALPASVAKTFEGLMRELRAKVFPPDAEPGTQVDLNGFLRALRQPVPIELPPGTTAADATHLLRGMTTEFHRPLRATALRGATSTERRAAIVELTAATLAELPFRILELRDLEWRRRAGRDFGAALGLAIPYLDRARRLPGFCERLVAAGSRTIGKDLAAVAQSFLKWDRALSAGHSSDWGPPRP